MKCFTDRFTVIFTVEITQIYIIIMTVLTIQQQKAKKGKIKAKLKDYRISLRAIEERSGELREDGRPFHRNTVWAAFDKDNKYYNESLIALAEKMIEEKKAGM